MYCGGVQLTPTAMTWRIVLQACGAFADILALAVVLAVLAGKADPRAGVRKLLQHARQCQRFAQARQGLAGQEIGAGIRQYPQARPMKVSEGGVRQRIAAAIFGAVREHGAIRADGCRDQRPQPAGTVRFFGPKLVACAGRHRHGVAHQLRRRLTLDAALRKGLEGRLIGRRGCDIGAGAKIVEMHCMDQLGPLDQAFRGPQRIVQIGAAAFELGRQCAVQHHHGTQRKETMDGVVHDCSRKALVAIILCRAFARGLLRDSICSPLRPSSCSIRTFSRFCMETWPAARAIATFPRRRCSAAWFT